MSSMASYTQPSRVKGTAGWILALLFSVLLHVGLVEWNPNLGWGLGPPGMREIPRTRPDLQVSRFDADRVRDELPNLLDRFREMEQEFEASESPLDPVDPLELSDLTSESELPDPDARADAMRTLSVEEVLPEPETVQFSRQEVMMVLAPRVEELVDVLPRQLQDASPTRVDAPDFNLPVPDLDLDALDGEPFAGLSLPAPRFEFETADAGGLAPGEGGHGVAFPEETEVARIEPVRLTELETMDEVSTGIDAIDALLRVGLQVFDPPDQPDWRYFKVQVQRSGEDVLPVMPRHLIFLLDCSSSMTQPGLDFALEGIRQSLDLLGDQDRVNVIAFRSGVEWATPEGVRGDISGRSRIRSYLFGLRAGGSTDVYASLQALKSLDSSPEKPLIAILITDGIPTKGLQDSSEIIEQFSRENHGERAVFGVGAGAEVNRLLIDFLSFRNRGSASIAGELGGFTPLIYQTVFETSRPVLSNVEAVFTGQAEVYPRQLTHLYLDRPLLMVGRVPRDSETLGMQIVGSSGRGQHDIVVELPLSDGMEGSEALRREWAWQALLDVLARGIDDPASAQQVDALLENYDLQIPSAYR